MIITQLSNGTVQYGGFAFDMLDYFSKALNIRCVKTTTYFKLKIRLNYNINCML